MRGRNLYHVDKKDIYDFITENRKNKWLTNLSFRGIIFIKEGEIYLSVTKKINDIMKEIKTIKKDGKIAFGNTRYSFITDDDVVQQLREEMVARGLIMYPIESESKVMDLGGKFLTITTQKFRIQDAEDDTFIEICTSGQGADSADKGSGKANTNSRKYALLQTFMLTGDDPDNVASDSYHQPQATVVDGKHLIPAGKYKGKYLEDVVTTDDGKNWATWYSNNGNNQELVTAIQQLVN